MYWPMPSGKTSAVNLMSFWHALGHGGHGPGQGHQAAPGHLPLVLAVVPPPGLVVRHRVVVGPGDPVPGQHVEDGPGGGIVEQVVGRVVDQAVRGSRDEETAVGERGPQARAEPAIGDREGARKSVVERQVVLAPVAHPGGRRLRRDVSRRRPPPRWPATVPPARWSRSRRICPRPTERDWRASSATAPPGAAPARAGERPGRPRRRCRGWTRRARDRGRAGNLRRGPCSMPR